MKLEPVGPVRRAQGYEKARVAGAQASGASRQDAHQTIPVHHGGHPGPDAGLATTPGPQPKREEVAPGLLVSPSLN